MLLDYNARRDTFIVRVEAGVDITMLMREHGLDYSTSASGDGHHVLFTKDPYCAASFSNWATPDAVMQLGDILFEISESERNYSHAHIACPADKELWSFQKSNIEYALRRRNTLIGDEPGLGKTAQAICFCNEIKADRVLIICPASLRYQWHKNIQEWSTMPGPHGRQRIYVTAKGKDGTNNQCEWQIVSYDLARTPAIGAALAREHYDALILDEPHYLKETNSQRTRAIFGGGTPRHFEPLASRAERVIGLTGTPLPNRPREAYTLARGLCWDSIDWASEEKFRLKYNPSFRYEHVDPATGQTKYHIDERSGRHGELQNRLRRYFMCRHLKHGPRGVMPQLKMPIYDLIYLEETRAVKSALEAEKLLDIDPEMLEGADMTTLGHISVVRKQMGIAMAPQVADYVEMLLESGEDKITLFAWHIEVLNILQHRLERYGLIRIDGSTGPKKKHRLVQDFINNPKCRIALGNILSMGTGTDGLQKVCTHGLIAEPDWVASNNVQCFDRLDRGGQREQVQGDIFVVRQSIAEKVLAAALRKNQITHKALDARVGDDDAFQKSRR